MKVTIDLNKAFSHSVPVVVLLITLYSQTGNPNVITIFSYHTLFLVLYSPSKQQTTQVNVP